MSFLQLLMDLGAFSYFTVWSQFFFSTFSYIYLLCITKIVIHIFFKRVLTFYLFCGTPQINKANRSRTCLSRCCRAGIRTLCVIPSSRDNFHHCNRMWFQRLIVRFLLLVTDPASVLLSSLSHKILRHHFRPKRSIPCCLGVTLTWQAERIAHLPSLASWKQMRSNVQWSAKVQISRYHPYLFIFFSLIFLLSFYFSYYVLNWSKR